MKYVQPSNKGSWRMSQNAPYPMATDKNEKFVYVPILKNAHSFVTRFFTKALNWTEVYNADTNGKVKIIMLRDPIERWISGTAEYFYTFHRNMNLSDDVIKILLDIIIIDHHTKPQVNSLSNIDLSNAVYFRVDDQLSNNLLSWTRKNINRLTIMPNGLWYNSSEQVEKKRNLKQRLYEVSLPYKERFMYCYEEDYKLLESINFYTGET